MEIEEARNFLHHMFTFNGDEFGDSDKKMFAELKDEHEDLLTCPHDRMKIVAKKTASMFGVDLDFSTFQETFTVCLNCGATGEVYFNYAPKIAHGYHPEVMWNPLPDINRKPKDEDKPSGTS